MDNFNKGNDMDYSDDCFYGSEEATSLDCPNVLAFEKPFVEPALTEEELYEKAVAKGRELNGGIASSEDSDDLIEKAIAWSNRTEEERIADVLANDWSWGELVLGRFPLSEKEAAAIAEMNIKITQYMQEGAPAVKTKKRRSKKKWNVRKNRKAA